MWAFDPIPEPKIYMMVIGKFAHCDYVNCLSVNLFCIYVVLKYTIIIIIIYDNKCEQMWTNLKKCEQMWTNMNKCGQM